MATIKKPAKKMQEGGKMYNLPKSKSKKTTQENPAFMANYQLQKDKFEYERARDLDKKRKEQKASKVEGITPDGKILKKGGKIKKAKTGGSFPDLNKDGKITKADILKGRGVIAKKGATLKKQAAVAIAMKKAGKAPKKMQYGGAAASMVPPMMKKGGATKKCKYGCK